MYNLRIRNVQMVYCLWSWSYGSWIYNYICNQGLSPLKLWFQIPFMARCSLYNIMWESLSVTCDRSVAFSHHSCFLHQINHDIPVTEILLRVALNTITLIPKETRNHTSLSWPLGSALCSIKTDIQLTYPPYPAHCNGVRLKRRKKIKALKFWSNDNKIFEYYICIQSPKTENKKKYQSTEVLI
jgi:hypothetical protein